MRSRSWPAAVARARVVTAAQFGECRYVEVQKSLTGKLRLEKERCACPGANPLQSPRTQQNLETSRVAGVVQRHRKQLIKEKLPFDVVNFTRADSANRVEPAAHQEAVQAAEEQVRKEFGDRRADLGENASVDALMKDLAVEERLDAGIDKCIKRLLLVRGVKSISASSSSASPKLLAAG